MGPVGRGKSFLLDVLADRDVEPVLVSARPRKDVLATGGAPGGWPVDLARTLSRLSLLRSAPAPGPQAQVTSAGCRGSSKRSTAVADAAGETSAR